MKNNIFLRTSIILISLLLTGPIFSQTVETQIQFSEADLIFSQSDGFDLVQVDSPRSYLDGVESEPLLPVVTADILLPAGAKIDNVRTVVEKESVISGNFNILPAQKLVPTSAAIKPDFVKPNPKIYGSSQRQREKAIDGFSRNIMRGNYIAGVKVNPLDYIPSEGKLILRDKIRIYVDYTIDKNNVTTIRSKKDKEFEQMIQDSVLNPEAISSNAEQTQTDTLMSSVEGGGEVSLFGAPPGDVVEYLIITKSEFADEFQVLADWKTKKGVPAEVVTIQWVYDNYTGTSQQQKIKNCIRDYVLNKGTVWVVLGADVDGIPVYYCYSECSGYVDRYIPTDLYYSDIDVLNWDGDGDYINGELEDGVDMGPDVFVGRISVSSDAEAAAYVSKSLAYEKNPPTSNFAEKLLLSGVLLWGQIGEMSDAEVQSEYMWVTQIDPHWWGTRYRFYDTGTDFAGGAAYDVNPGNMNEQINIGYNFLHTNTHGDVGVWGGEGLNYIRSSVDSLTNAGKYVNIMTGACYSNAFDDYYICLGEAFTRKANAGAVSYIGCSRYGWGYEGGYPGPSLQYNQVFYNYLFRGSYGNNLGKVFARMKESKLPITSYGAMHWIQYGLNLLGDPELPLYINNPTPMYPVYNSQIETGSQTFVVNARTLGAKVCLFMENEVYAYGYTDSNANFSAQINPTHPGQMSVTITETHKRPYEGVVTVGIPPAAPANLTATAGQNLINLDWDDNNEPDLMQYNVYRANAAEGPYNQIAVVTDSNFTDDNLYGLTYFYRVTAVDNSENESPFSEIASAMPVDTIPPAIPANITATAGDRQVILEWDYNNEPDLGGYNVYRSLTSGSGYILTASDVTVSNYTDTVANGSTYYYVVTSVDTGNLESAYSSQVSAFPRDYIAPAAPTGLKATTVNSQYILDWNDNTEYDLSHYKVYRSPSSGGPYSIIKNNQVTSTYTDTNVVPGTPYYYVVTAVDTSTNESPYSNQVAVSQRTIFYYPSSYTVVTGSYYSGSISGLTADDSSYLVIRSQTSGSTRYARTDFTVTGIMTGSPAKIDLQVITKSTNIGTQQNIYIYNYTTALWHQTDSFTVGTKELTRNMAITAGMSNYINGGQLKVRIEGYKTNSTTIRLSHDLVLAKITF
jgi:fibronectin type 3 domain-containing protein